MLEGYFSLQREAEDMFACLLIHPSERIIGMSMTSSGLQPQLFPLFSVVHLTCPAPHFQFLASKAATNFKSERRNMKKK